MVARNEADWEERLWHLTHDLVVRMAPENADDGVDAEDAAIECCQIAAATVNVYRAAVQVKAEGT